MIETQTKCEWCGSDAVDAGSTCPRSVECPHCHARPGSPCRRPSDHRAAMMHAARWELAEGMDEHAGGQVRIGAPGDQLELLPIADQLIPNDTHETTPAEHELRRREEGSTDA